jgi:N-methylhydantoinase A/oxoprolinase/acetone carboxylase beta subunit
MNFTFIQVGSTGTVIGIVQVGRVSLVVMADSGGTTIIIVVLQKKKKKIYKKKQQKNERKTIQQKVEGPQPGQLRSVRTAFERVQQN